jgi:hypothetical protein
VLRRRLTGVTAACALAASLVTVTGAAAPSQSALGRSLAAAELQASSLRVTPEVFVGGQSLTFAGSLPGAAGRDLRLQRLFNRPGDSWVTLPGRVGRADGSGGFRFTHPAPSNYQVRYRVKAVGGPVSPAVKFEARQQELALFVNGGGAQQPRTVVSGTSFSIDVDTTVTGRGELGRPAPAFPGRSLALQQRVQGDRWATVATTTSSANGTARFVRTAGSPGSTAYRVRQAAISTDGNEIGWFPSFPVSVRVVARGDARAAAPVPAAAPRLTTSTSPRPMTAVPSPAARASGAPQAGQRLKWGPSLWDFAWEQGEALTAKPYRGQRRTGRWIDRSSGSGRVAPYNGGMALSTHLSGFPGRGDRGTTSATLSGNAMTYGRWEFRRRIDVFENSGRNYRVKIALVPARARDARCGSINVGSVAFNSRKASLGLSSARAGRSWSGTRRIPRLGDGAHSFAVEVTRSHVTWFLNGRSLATVRSRKAAPGVPLTPKLSLVGRGNQEMRRTRVLYDWQRGWRLNKQARKAPRGPSLKAKNYAKSC